MNEQEMVSREKYWKELTDSEKIERMREVVKNIKFQLDEFDKSQCRVNSEVQQFKQKMYEHKHLDGNVVCSLKSNGFDPVRDGEFSTGRNIKPQNPDEVYF